MVSLGFVGEAEGAVPGFPLLRLRRGGAKPGPLLQCDGRRVGWENCALIWIAPEGAEPRQWSRELADCLDGLGWERWRLARDSWDALGGLTPKALDDFGDAFWPVYRPIGRVRVLLDVPDDAALRDTARAWCDRYRRLRFDLDLQELLKPPEIEKKDSMLARLGPTISRNLKALPKRIGKNGHRRVRPGKD
ncbi:MAG: hypothetical protein ACOCVM_03235 [Desulfovibrionaceae bacterium]